VNNQERRIIMTQEEKQLLIKVLCEMLPYGVMCRMSGGGFETIEENKLTAIGLFQFIEEGLECIPYLRPISSLTKKERLEIGKAIQKDRINPSGEIKAEGSDNLLLCTVRQSANLMEWLNAHHFDYRGLIEKGLALEAPKEMYNTKTE